MYKKGFTPIIIVSITILLVAGLGGYIYFQSKDKPITSTTTTVTDTNTNTTVANITTQSTTKTTLLKSPTSLIKPEWLGEPHYTPDFVYALERTDVLFEILVNKRTDNLASESSVQLFKKDENANWVLLDEMFDDGYLGGHGDKTKGDRTYANTIEFYEENIRDIRDIPLKVMVTTFDNQQYSVEFNLTVLSKDLFEKALYETEEASNRVEQKLIEIMQSPPSDLGAVAQMLCNYLIEQTDIIASCEISNYSVWVTCNTGVLMEFSLRNLDEKGEPPEGL